MLCHAPFERLVESATLIARHPDCPGKPEVVERCEEEIAELLRAGRLTDSQGELLSQILQGSVGRKQSA